ncbi:MAG: HAMP domain-containing protein [Gammaproteobacteria bacterium]|nr:HAMP domain-containing protein [Gammaproteobacteria bacterium]
MNDNNQKPKLGFGIFHKLLIVLVLVSMLPLVVVWYVNYNTTTAQLTQSVHQRLESLTGTLVTQVNDLMEMNYRMLRENAAEPAIRSMVPNRQKPILRLIKAEYPWIHSVLVIDPQGNSISRGDGLALKNYSERGYVRQILAGKPTAYQVLVGKTTGLPGLTLATAIRDESGRLKGMLAISMAAALISDRVVDSRIGKTGYAFLLDRHGKVIAHQSMQDSMFRKDFSAHPAFVAHTREGSAATLITPDERGKTVIYYMKTTSDGWTLITQQDYDEAFSTITSVHRNALVLLLVTLIVALIIAYILSRRLTRPIRHLTSIANEASLANFKALDGEKVAGIERSDEIGELARSVERLALSLRVAIGRLNKGS